MTKSDILTPLQRTMLDLVFSDNWFRDHFYLTGGTALAAFYLHHRYSDDLDFFSHGIELMPITKLMDDMQKKSGKPISRVQTSPGFMRFIVDNELKLDFVSDVDFRISTPHCIGGVMVDDIKNIAVNKVTAILGRFDSKDYVDLYMLIQKEKYDILDLLALGQKKDAGLDAFIWASLIADVDRLPLLPRMITPVTLDELRQFFFTLRDKILDSINPTKA